VKVKGKAQERKMGSSQSSIAADAPQQQQAMPAMTPVTEKTPKQVESSAVITDNTNKKKKPKKERKGYDLVQYKCRRRKAAYDKCYNEWYGKKFLTAEDIERDESCDELFDIWKECIMRGMVKEWKSEGLDPPKEGSILGEYLQEERDE
jgi:hypothetical protein